MSSATLAGRTSRRSWTASASGCRSGWGLAQRPPSSTTPPGAASSAVAAPPALVRGGGTAPAALRRPRRARASGTQASTSATASTTTTTSTTATLSTPLRWWRGTARSGSGGGGCRSRRWSATTATRRRRTAASRWHATWNGSWASPGHRASRGRSSTAAAKILPLRLSTPTTRCTSTGPRWTPRSPASCAASAASWPPWRPMRPGPTASLGRAPASTETCSARGQSVPCGSTRRFSRAGSGEPSSPRLGCSCCPSPR
mmetsp:Transcript_54840/g.142782  ORF Transcript_54840/g.142782 Transcript_54840/m.142782 type:complete len:258 (-) Transcript_54840:498-1271(-)